MFSVTTKDGKAGFSFCIWKQVRKFTLKNVLSILVLYLRHILRPAAQAQMVAAVLKDTVRFFFFPLNHVKLLIFLGREKPS